MVTYHAESERVDVIDVFEAVLPWDETLDVDVELVPDGHDGIVILLIPRKEHKPLTPLKETIYHTEVQIYLTLF